MNVNLPAPALQVSSWLNAPDNFGLEDLLGRVVVVEAFQMLCPGCVSHGLPQVQRVIEAFDPNDVAVIGLHTVFEHHAAQGTRTALEAFAHEYRLSFPIAIDKHDRNNVPMTMQAYEMQGTPTLILLDKAGRRRLQYFGRLDDMRLGASIMSLVRSELESSVARPTSTDNAGANACDSNGCVLA